MALVQQVETESPALAGNSGGTATGVLTAPSITTVVGDVVIVWFLGGSEFCLPNSAPPAVTGLTWTNLIARFPTASCSLHAWVGKVTTAATVAITCPWKYTKATSTGSTQAHLVVERHQGVATPAAANATSTATALALTGTTGPTLAYSTTKVGSSCSWAAADYNGVVTGAPATFPAGDFVGATMNGVNGNIATVTGMLYAEAVGSKTAGVATYSTSATRKMTMGVIELPPTGGPTTDIVDDFSAAALDTAKWATRNFVTLDTQLHAARIAVAYGAGAPQYAALRSGVGKTLLGASTYQVEARQLPWGTNGNVQVWLMQPGAVVGRVGFEYNGAADRLDLVAQGPGYATVGTTVSIAAPTRAVRWWALTLGLTNGLQWWTSPDGATWSNPRTIPFATVLSSMPWLLRGDMLESFEGFGNAAGANGVFVIDNVNAGPPVEPAWAPGGRYVDGTLLWSADFSQPDAVAAGYVDDSWQRQRADGSTATELAWPPPTAPAPFGAPGRALPIRLPDGFRRYEVVPNVADFADGDERWIGFLLYIEGDTDEQAAAGSGYQVVWQLRPGDSTGSPPLALEVVGGALKLTGGYNRPDPSTGAPSGSTYAYQQTLLSPVPKGRWIGVVMYVAMWSKPNSGRVDVWLDGTSVLTNFRPPPGTNFGTGDEVSYPKNGLYHDGANRGATVWFANHKIGTAWAVVDPTATITAYGDDPAFA